MGLDFADRNFNIDNEEEPYNEDYEEEIQDDEDYYNDDEDYHDNAGEDDPDENYEDADADAAKLQGQKKLMRNPTRKMKRTTIMETAMETTTIMGTITTMTSKLTL